MAGKSKRRKDEAFIYIMLHKPSGVECSRSPSAHRSVFDLLPPEFLKNGVQPVGRLDADTTGLLILTNDGELNHVLTSPRRKLPKTYRVELKHPLTEEQIQRLSEGVVLRDDPEPTAPAHVLMLSEREMELTITEGRYHQVKRWLAVAAVLVHIGLAGLFKVMYDRGVALENVERRYPMSAEQEYHLPPAPRLHPRPLVGAGGGAHAGADYEHLRAAKRLPVRGVGDLALDGSRRALRVERRGGGEGCARGHDGARERGPAETR